MPEVRTILGPRITVQFEIDGTESDIALAEMKKTEVHLEKIFADMLKKHMEEILKEGNSND